MPALVDEELNKVDRYATRVFTLAVKFFGTRHAVSSSSIRDELYPDIDETSFRRQFLRDRNLLASLGIVVREVEVSDSESSWQVDERTSYVQGEGIDAHDAKLLYILCHDMILDQAFSYRDELRVALVKIARSFEGSAVVQPASDTSYDHKILAALVSAMTNREAVEVRYVDAQGNKSKRLLALFGSFGLRERTYFVASRIERSGELVPDSIRTYRLDRFSSISATRPTISYQIPLDFSVHDYEHLPFQIGNEQGIALIDVGTEPSREVTRAMSSSGRMIGPCIWEVPYSSIKALASWCVGTGIVPQGPEPLVVAWKETIQASADSELVDSSLSNMSGIKMRHASSRRRSSPDAITKVRQLMALAGALDKEGEVVTAQQVAESLGVSHDQARRLIMLMSMGSGESYDYLPVVIDDDYDEVFLMEGAKLVVPRVRLTRSETLALLAALATLGVPSDDPIVTTLSNTFVSPLFTAEDVARSLELADTNADADNLRVCRQAIADGKGLTFWYRPVTGSGDAQREVVPTLVRHRDDNWYLEAYDTIREDTRIFRVDRMDDPKTVELVEELHPQTTSHHDQMVTLLFDDPFYLDLFHWDGLEVIRVSKGSTIARLPFYGGSWLARHLVACAGTVRMDDKGLATQVREIAAALLS